MDKENQKVQIKVERHRWPDEIEKEKKKRRTIYITALAVFVSFALGWIANQAILGPSQASAQTNNTFQRVYQDLLDNWYFTRDMDNPEEELLVNAINGMLDQNGDIHTSFMTQDELADLNSSINMEFVGIGVQYYEGDNVNLITDVFKNSPAEKAGIQAGDIIYKVNGTLISESDTTVKEMILGDEGSEVTVDVKRNNEVLSFTMVRSTVNALATGRMLNDKTAYLEITSFGIQLGEIVEEHLKDFKGQGATNLVIDLRDNGGGYLNAINDIARLFLKNGDVVYQEEFTSGKKDVYTVKNSVADQYPFDQITILINGNSASASEVLTLALTENLGATTVGTKSYGKGTVQSQRVYSDQSSLKITIAKWMGPTGTSINGTGIEPDVEVALDDIFYAIYPEMEDRVIHYDEVGLGVDYVQKGLKYLGFHTGRTDGYFDAATRDALQAYGVEVGLSDSSIIDAETVKQVYSSVVADWSLNRQDRDVQLHKAIEVTP